MWRRGNSAETEEGNARVLTMLTILLVVMWVYAMVCQEDLMHHNLKRNTKDRQWWSWMIK
ncbi:hypothetical protein E2C01_022732 [Portunus trituberculatus]|uniref:Uncharacterized protein n=1 Tax=Portunus trituberculatus TaxID=210409 RepID=A0A5B7E8E6_PORTR|nr:hypothetical protein [Portunus trituberculatus]